MFKFYWITVNHDSTGIKLLIREFVEEYKRLSEKCKHNLAGLDNSANLVMCKFSKCLYNKYGYCTLIGYFIEGKCNGYYFKGMLKNERY